jgi:hypothetical protein
MNFNTIQFRRGMSLPEPSLHRPRFLKLSMVHQ